MQAVSSARSTLRSSTARPRCCARDRRDEPGCNRVAGRDVPARPVDAAQDPGSRHRSRARLGVRERLIAEKGSIRGAAAPRRARRHRAGGCIQQRFCRRRRLPRIDRDPERGGVRAATVLALTTHFAVHDGVRCRHRRRRGRAAERDAWRVAVRARDQPARRRAVSMLFCVIPAVAGILSWLMLGQRVDIGTGVGLLLGALACWLNASGKKRQHDPGRDGRRKDRVETVISPP